MTATASGRAMTWRARSAGRVDGIIRRYRLCRVREIGRRGEPGQGETPSSPRRDHVARKMAARPRSTHLASGPTFFSGGARLLPRRRLKQLLDLFSQDPMPAFPARPEPCVYLLTGPLLH